MLTAILFSDISVAPFAIFWGGLVLFAICKRIKRSM